MSKQVLIISSSPRKGGNSDTLCDQFLKGAAEAGNRVEKIRLADLKIDYCSACYACKTTGRCVKRDEMEQIIEKMRDADVIVLATPVSVSLTPLSTSFMRIILKERYLMNAL